MRLDIKGQGTLLAPSIPAKEAINLISVENTPWLTSISKDGSVWRIKGGSGAKQKTKVLDFNYMFPDGSVLTDKKNTHFYEFARAYAWVFRLYSAQSDPKIQVERVNALVTFFFWLRLHNVSSLSSVTSDHIDIYAEKIALGREWARDAPHRLYSYIKRTLAEKEALPRQNKKRGPGPLQRSRIYQESGVSYFPFGESFYLTSCAQILNWLEANGNENANLPAFEDLIKECRGEPSAMTVQSIHRALLPIEELWLYRHQLPENNLKKKPFFRGASDRAQQLGEAPNRIPTIPPHLGMRFVSQALTWILDYGQIIAEEVASTDELNVLRLSQRLNRAGLEIVVHNKYQSNLSIRKVNLIRLVEIHAAACFVVIAAFTARRVEEIADLGAGSIEKDGAGHHWLKIYIEKTSQRYDQIPVPISVQKAISSMESISKGAREKSDDDSIWQMEVTTVRKIKPSMYLNELAYLLGIVDEKDNDWRFSAHQFRRFFAILYFWRYEKGDLPAISHHLRHFDLEMTKRYVTDGEMGQIWKEVEAEWQGEFIRDVIDGSRSVGGKAGVRLKREADKLMTIFRRSVDVVAPERVIETLLRLAKRLGSEFRQHVWGTICACPKNTKFAEHARCKGAERIGPVFKNASEDLCSACPFAIHTDRFMGAAAKDLELRKATALCSGSDTILSELSKVQIVSLESLLKNAQPLPMLSEESNG